MTVDAISVSTGPLPGMTRWDRIAKETSWGRYLTEIEQQLILRGEALAGSRSRAVDLGCGGGRWSKLLSERGWAMTSIDVNPQALDICKRNVPAAQCLLTREEDCTIPIATGGADLALCIEVFSLIEAPWFMPEVKRVLSERGLLIGVYSNRQSLRAMVWRMRHRWGIGDSREQFYRNSYVEWRRRVQAQGFEMLHEESCCWAPFSRDSNSRFVPACTKVERVLGLRRFVAWSPWITFIARKAASG